MRFLDLTLPTLEENLALDEALLLWAEDGGPAVLRFWEWPRHAVVLGAGCRLADDVNDEACQEDGVPLARRSSGGGTVLLGAGCLLYSLVVPFDLDPALEHVNPSYRYILTEVAAALAGIAPGVAHAGTSDLACGSRKCSGNAQHRKRRHLLHHGSLLYAFDLERVPRYLHVPARQPDYRAGREHVDFLMNLPTDAATLKQRLHSRLGAEEPLQEWPRNRVADLVKEKYGRTDWTRRR